jgi:hypothetical protein
MGGNKSTDRFVKAVNQLETMKEYALAGKTCRHAQVSAYVWAQGEGTGVVIVTRTPVKPEWEFLPA